VWFSYDIDELLPWLIWWNLLSISLVLTDENFECLSGTRNIRLVEEKSGDPWAKLDREIDNEDILDKYEDLSWEEARDEAQNQLQLGKAILATKKMAEILSSCEFSRNALINLHLILTVNSYKEKGHPGPGLRSVPESLQLGCTYR
jgi:hypothetical protein